jgi:glycosyltransferase involved in cell wall biosynthesis
VSEPPLRIAFVAPAYWPAEAFGGPIAVLRALARELVERGHSIDVWTTSLERVDRRGQLRSRTTSVDGATVRYLATPIRYRWMGFTPTLSHNLRHAPAPDVAHIFGFRDPLGFSAARWFRRHRVPYVFEALGMFRPKLRKQALKRVLDATVLVPVTRHAEFVMAASAVERQEYLDAGISAERVVVRPNGIPQVPHTRSGELRERIGLGAEPLLLYAGRVADGKGLDLLVRALPDLHDAHLAVVGPDDGHGTTRMLGRLAAELGVAERVHLLGQWPEQPLTLYGDADVVALPSAHENFGMAAAEAASAGVAVVVTDRCGVAELLRDHGALVVGYDVVEVRAAIARLLADPDLRRRLGKLGSTRAAEFGWPSVAALQESIYRRVVG